MAKAFVVTYLIALLIGLAVGYANECAVGPEYWCKSFANAQDCGAIRHCTDTVWSSDDKYALVDSSTTCQWCQRIFGNIQKGLGDNEDMFASILTDGCKLLPSDDHSSKCINMVENYQTSVVSLLKNKRYATLCRLMNICSDEKPSIIIGNSRCTWGPSYWCSSLSNSRECNSIDHCSNQIWSQQTIKKKDNDNICQYCEYIIDQLRSRITENKTEIDVEKWLAGACSMLQTKDAIDECLQTMSQYAKEIFILIKNNIDSGIICHLGQMCKDATIVSNDEQSKMLCNVIVRATYDLHVNQKKNQNEIEIFLKNDCQQLSNSELIQKCEGLVEQYSMDIYGYIVNNNMELSKICDKTVFQSRSNLHCDLCTFVLTTTKAMIDANQPEDEILRNVDEHLCSHLNGDIKKNCKYMIGKDLIDKIKQGTQPMLLCTYFQVCFDELIDKTSPIQKDEILAFLKENICDNLGPFEDSCNALIEKDTTRLLKTLVNDMEGDVLCQIFGICQMKMSFIDNLSINDNTNKCKRCVDHFIRRKHIAEKILNYSSEFLHHLCAQLPQKDECMKSVDEPINKLVKFIQSLNPQDICVELKICNKTLLEEIEINSSDNVISEEVIVYIKNEICAKLGSLSNLCNHLMDSEGAGLFHLISKDVDPHRICSVIDVCPTTTSFENCADKCECCVSKVENYQVQLATFLETMLTTAEAVCKYIPDSKDCREIAGGLKLNIDEIISGFNAKRICEVLTHCSVPPAKCDIDDNKCQCCENNLNTRQNNFRKIINEITTTHLSCCMDDDNSCRSIIQSNREQILNKIDKIHSLTICQRFGFCPFEQLQRSIPFLSNLMINNYSDLDSAIQDLSENLCTDFQGLKPICEHLLTSIQNTRYLNVYKALLNNNPTLIDNDLREQNTNTCDECKNAVQTGKDFWLNSLESVRNALLQTCEYCPSKDQCRAYLNQRFDNLKAYINQINPEQFCQNIHLCSISLTNTCSTCIQHLELKKDGILQAIDRLAGYFNDLCQQYAEKQCQIFIKEIKDSIQNSIEEFDIKQICTSIGFCDINGNEINFDQYEKYLDDEIEKNICSNLGPFETLCKYVIHGNTKEIQALEMNYNIDDLMKIGEELTDTSSDIEDVNDRDKCQCCIARVIRRKRRTKFIGDNIFYALIRSCDRCPAKHQCRRHFRCAKARFDAHIDRICPKRVCIHLGFCNKTIESTKSEIEEIKPIDNSNSTCILCEYVMNILSNYIHNQSTEEEIEENLQKICNQIPSILQNQCREYIDNYSPTIISILLQEFNPSTICHKINLCTNQMNVDITNVIKANTATCGICDYISTYLHFSLERDSNDKSLQHALATVCTHLSDEQSPKCEIIIQLLSPTIRQLELSPGNNFCKQLTICQTPMIELEPGIVLNKEDTKPIEVSFKEVVGQLVESAKDSGAHLTSSEETEDIKPAIVETDSYEQSVIDESLVPENLSAIPKCTICQYVISYLDAVLKNNKSEQAVEEALKKVCTILPDKARTECIQFIKSYGPVIAELIAGAADPDTICRYIGVCQDSSTKKSTTVVVQTPYTCTICQYIVSRMKYFVDLNQEEKEVFQSLKESCDLFSVIDLKQQCKDFLDQHGSYFSQRIFNEIQPKIACQNIGICCENDQKSTTPTPVVSSTKYGKCIFGMNYWCTTRANAELCNAVELCERQVWSKKNIVIN